MFGYKLPVVIALAAPRHRVSRRCPFGATLVILAAIVPMLVGGGLIGHLHEDSSPGFYNERHVLNGLAAPSHGIPVPAPSPAIGLAPTASAVVLAPTPAASAPAALHPESRAPPSA